MHATVLVTLRYGLAARNVLRTGVFRGLREAGHRIVLVCPAAHEGYLIDEVAGPNVILEPYPQIHESKAEAAFAAVTDALLCDHPGVTATLTIKWRHLAATRQHLSFAAKGLAAILRLHRSKILRSLGERLDYRWFVHPEVTSVLQRYHPALVVTTDLFGEETHFVREARRRGIPTVCLVKSWDNLTSKGRIRVCPDYLVVWSNLMRVEATRHHFIAPDQVFVSGAPNFDLFGAGLAVGPRDQFMRSIGADPRHRLIVYSPGYKFTSSDDENILRIHRILQSGTLGEPCHLHIRKYPKSPQDFSHLLGHPGLTVEDAGIIVPTWGDRIDQPMREMAHLGSLMHHADLLIHLGSTIAVDAACFDTPIIGYALDATDSRLPWNHAARRVFQLTHNRYLVDLGGVRIVHTESELVQAMRTYLRRPETDRDGRRRIVQEICGWFDGRSGDRIAEFLMRVLSFPPAAPREPAPTRITSVRTGESS